MYYAEQSPRGFSNEIVVHAFRERSERDAWVEEHRHDGDVRSAYCGALACTAKAARDILRRRPDALTQMYNSLVVHEA